ncbi:MAG TPA: hypothetical protein VII70_11455 [Steroidobacteraceae bacterium]
MVRTNRLALGVATLGAAIIAVASGASAAPQLQVVKTDLEPPIRAGATSPAQCAVSIPLAVSTATTHTTVTVAAAASSGADGSGGGGGSFGLIDLAAIASLALMRGASRSRRSVGRRGRRDSGLRHPQNTARSAI